MQINERKRRKTQILWKNTSAKHNFSFKNEKQICIEKSCDVNFKFNDQNMVACAAACKKTITNV